MIFALATLVVAMPPSSVIPEVASIGDVVFDPLITNTDMTRGWATDRLIVAVCPVPTLADFAYHI